MKPFKTIFLLFPFLLSQSLAAAVAGIYGGNSGDRAWLADCLGMAGFEEVRMLTEDDLGALDPDDLALLALLPGARFPAEHRVELSEYLAAAGNLMQFGADSLDYAPQPVNPVQVTDFSNSGTFSIEIPAAGQAFDYSRAPLAYEGVRQSAVDSPSGAGVEFRTHIRALPSVRVQVPLRGHRSSGRSVLRFPAKGDYYVDILTLRVFDDTGGEWLGFVQPGLEWREFIVSLADLVPAGWNDPLKPYPLLDPARVERLVIGNEDRILWRERPGSFALGPLELCENANPDYTPTSELPRWRVQYEELGTRSPEWIVNPFQGAAATVEAFSLEAPRIAPFERGATLALTGPVPACPPPYQEVARTRMGTDHKSALDPTARQSLRRIPLLIKRGGNPYAAEDVLAEIRMHAGGRYIGAGVILVGVAPGQVTDPSILAQLVADAAGYVAFRPRILQVMPNTTVHKMDDPARFTLSVLVKNPLPKLVSTRVSVSVAGGLLIGSRDITAPRNGTAERVLELSSDIPAGFPFERFDWEVRLESADGSDLFRDSVDLERTTAEAFQYMTRLQDNHADARYSHHYFGDMYGVRAMFAFIEYLEGNPAAARRLEPVFARGSSLDRIRQSALDFCDMLVRRQNEDGSLPMGYGEHHFTYNVADGGQIALGFVQILQYLEDDPERQRAYLQLARKFYDWAESYYITEELSKQLAVDYPDDVERNRTKAGHYGLGIARAKRNPVGPFWVLPDVMGVNAALIAYDPNPLYPVYAKRNTRYYLDQGYSAQGYFHAEALFWMHFTLDDPKLSKGIRKRLSETFIPYAMRGKPRDMFDIGSRGTLRNLPLVYYRDHFEDSSAVRAGLLKAAWDWASPSSSFSMTRVAERHPKSLHGTSVAAAKLAAYSTPWAVEILLPGSTLLPGFTRQK